ncbi:LytR/AlgR family response regulator transcription factor [Rubrivirga sp.]|uniref:LytR/AlgR family response regulator transcription factor n=1 Tax=Rubrivirga sp. TaxID=1885344 RepID=UPI003B52820C
MIEALIVDDEPLAREGLRLRLADVPDVEVVGTCASGREAVVAIGEHAPDLVFLDVQMPGLDGFDVLAELAPEQVPYVVFVTAYDVHALRAFECHALDYLLKPVDPDRLDVALDRARDQIQQRTLGHLDDRLRVALAALKQLGPAPGERFAVKSRGGIVLVPIEDVDWIEASGDYVTLHAGERAHLLRGTMAQMERRLGPTFVRVHRSAMVRVDRVRELRTLDHGEYEVHLTSGARLKLSRSYRRDVQDALGATL